MSELSVIGARNPHAKLTDETVTQIRLLAKTGVSKKGLAERFGLSISYIGDVIRGRRWKHVQC